MRRERERERNVSGRILSERFIFSFPRNSPLAVVLHQRNETTRSITRQSLSAIEPAVKSPVTYDFVNDIHLNEIYECNICCVSCFVCMTNHFFDETELTVIRPAAILMMVKVTRRSSFSIKAPVKQDSRTEPGQGINGHDHDYGLTL